MRRLGLVGWRGMVGSVLLERMDAEGDFRNFHTTFFSTSSPGAPAPLYSQAESEERLQDAFSLEKLQQMDVIISCQGGDYTKAIHPQLRGAGWQGYWIDAASALRTAPSSTLILDPVNRAQIDHALGQGGRDFIGPNCVISLALMGLAGLLGHGLIEWMSMMTYQAASGAGAAQLRELLLQMATVSRVIGGQLDDENNVLQLCHQVECLQREGKLPQQALGAPLVGNILPWIDSDLGGGVSREEWKAEVEANKILGWPEHTLRIDGLCIRVPVLRCHTSAITLKLKQELSQQQVEALIKNSHHWLRFIENNRKDSLTQLTPAATSNTLDVAVGRLRPLALGEGRLWSVLVTGDQLLWGAAEPLRRMLHILPLES